MGDQDPRTATAVQTRGRASEVNNNLLDFDTTKSLANTSPGGKYLIMERTDKYKTMENVSPFLLKRVINCICGEVEKCTKLRNGTVLIKTKTVAQAEKLIKLIKMDAQTHVSISEHKFLNTSRGTIFSHDLKFLSDDVILTELKEQNIIAVRRILKKVETQEERTQTGLFILTFSITELPSHIFAGYTKLYVKPYIPPPLRCMNCLHFGHITTNCKEEKNCSNCGLKYHLIEVNQKCDRNAKCINCLGNHHGFTKICKSYLKEREIQEIKVIEKVSIKEAMRRYRERHPLQFNRSYAEVTQNITSSYIPRENSIPSPQHQKENPNNKSDKTAEEKLNLVNNPTTTAPVSGIPSTSKRTRSNDSSNSLNETDTSVPPKLSPIIGKKKVQILPRKLTARQKKVLKNTAKVKKQKDNKGNVLHSDSSSVESLISEIKT